MSEPPPQEPRANRVFHEPFDLPPLPAVARRVLESIHSGRATATEIADLLGADPALVVQILKIVNSAYYGLPRRIAEVRHAVAYLGLAEIERLALAATVMKEFATDDVEELQRFWFHSFYSALICKRLARQYAKNLDAEELHTAALLHDVGKLVQLKFYPETYARMMRYCRARGRLLVEAERRFECPSHVMLGATLCERWNLPECVARACARHEPEQLEGLEPSAPRYEETRLICVANLLSNLAGDELAAEVKQQLREAALRALGNTEEEFLLQMGEVYALKTEVEAFLRQL
jgi:putative nucleotidyltransferase with HDIG domain